MNNDHRTKHAHKRMQQRGINETMIQLIEMFGEYYYQKGGSQEARVSSKTVSKLRASLDKLNGVKAVYSGSGVLITVMHDSR